MGVLVALFFRFGDPGEESFHREGAPGAPLYEWENGIKVVHPAWVEFLGKHGDRGDLERLRRDLDEENAEGMAAFEEAEHGEGVRRKRSWWRRLVRRLRGV